MRVLNFFFQEYSPHRLWLAAGFIIFLSGHAALAADTAADKPLDKACLERCNQFDESDRKQCLFGLFGLNNASEIDTDNYDACMHISDGNNADCHTACKEDPSLVFDTPMDASFEAE